MDKVLAEGQAGPRLRDGGRGDARLHADRPGRAHPGNGPVHEPTDGEVDEPLAELAKQNRTYETRVARKATKAKDGDQVVIDFIGRIDGEPFEGGAATDARLVLGSGQFIPGFEEQLVGAKPGGKPTVKVTFPEDYPVDAPVARAKPRSSRSRWKEVSGPGRGGRAGRRRPAKRLGLETLEALKQALKAQLTGEFNNASRFKLKRALLDALDKGHEFELPPRMVDAEFDMIWQQVEADKEGGGLPPEDEGKSEDQLRGRIRRARSPSAGCAWASCWPRSAAPA